MRLLTLFLMLFLWSSSSAFAEEEKEEAGEEAESAVPSIYIPLKPQFVVNYGGVGKRHFLKADVTLRLADSDAANSVRHHMPFIRNNLVMVFAAQTNETLESQEGREAMRAAALAEVRSVLAAEDGIEEEKVVDVLFNAFTWH